MSEERLSDALGIDQAAEESLGRAGVRTPQELSDADAEQLAMASGIPIDRIREWQQRARRAGARGPRRSPVMIGWLVAIIGLVIAVVLGWAMMSIGAGRISRAEKLRRTTESKLEVAVSFAADEAMEGVREARLAIRSKNWGSAQATLDEVGDCIEFMDSAAPQSKAAAVAEVGAKFEKLREAVEAQAKDAQDQLDALEANLHELAQSK